MRALPLLSLVLAAACADATRDERPNVLLISLDSARADHLSCYGYRSPHAPEVQNTPAIDQLAAEGVLFEEALATTSWTLPSHVAMLTGLPDLAHGVELDAFRIADEHTTLAERLGAAGYRTAGFFSGPYLEPRFGFGRGFERYVACYGDALTSAVDVARRASRDYERVREAGDERDEASLYLAWEREAQAQRRVEVESHRDVSTPAVTQAALAELDAAADDGRPFFLFAHYFDPHFDYVPPAPFDTSLDPDYDGPVTGEGYLADRAISELDASAPSGRVRTASERDLAHLQALYAGELAATDAAVGRLLDRLDELKLAENTLVVLVGDHGDEFFEHGGIGHRRTLHREVLRVPLVLRLPGGLPAGTRVPEPVSTASLTPTVLELLGVSGRAEPAAESLLVLLGGADGVESLGVLSRLVRTNAAEVELLVGGEPLRVSVDRVRITETFRDGSLKLTRERDWIVPLESTDPDLVAPLLAEGARRRAVETLRWIDLDEHPEERNQDHVTDFSGPRARAALGKFRTRYRELAARRLAIAPDAETADLEALLAGLGYTGRGSETVLVSNALLLPLPGEREWASGD